MPKVKYKSICTDPKENPFHPRSPTNQTKVVEIDASMPIAEVKRLAEEDAKDSGFNFVRLEQYSEIWGKFEPVE